METYNSSENNIVLDLIYGLHQNLYHLLSTTCIAQQLERYTPLQTLKPLFVTCNINYS